MKRFTLSLAAAALAAITLAGCSQQAPSSVSAGTGSSAAAVSTQASVPTVAPSTNNLEEKKKDTLGEEGSRRVELRGPLEPATSASPAESEPTAAPVDDSNPLPADSAGTRPKADREPTKPGDPEKITFDDLILGMQADMVYRPFMLTDRAKELEGKKVRLSGEMWPGASSTKLKEFILLRNTKCLYGKGGQADHVADIKMKEGHTIDFSTSTVRVEGKLRIVPRNSDLDGTTMHIYVLEDAVAK